MALGTITVAEQQRKMASAPLGVARLTFLGDDSYAAGGTVGFQALVRAALLRDVTVICVAKGGPTGVYTAIYDAASDKLYVEDAAGAEASGDLSGTTFNLLVFYE